MIIWHFIWIHKELFPMDYYLFIIWLILHLIHSVFLCVGYYICFARLLFYRVYNPSLASIMCKHFRKQNLVTECHVFVPERPA